MSSVPLGVKFYNDLWTEAGLGYIASIIGTPLYLYEPTFLKNRLAFARVSINGKGNWDVPKSSKINLGYGEPYEITVEVSWMSKKSYECTFGHSSQLCPLKPKPQNATLQEQEWRVKQKHETPKNNE